MYHHKWDHKYNILQGTSSYSIIEVCMLYIYMLYVCMFICHIFTCYMLIWYMFICYMLICYIYMLYVNILCYMFIFNMFRCSMFICNMFICNMFISVGRKWNLRTASKLYEYIGQRQNKKLRLQTISNFKSVNDTCKIQKSSFCEYV